MSLCHRCVEPDLMWRFIDTMNDGEASIAADPAIRGIDHRQCDRGGHGRIDGVTAGRQHFYAGPCCKTVGRHDGSPAARSPSDVTRRCPHAIPRSMRTDPSAQDRHAVVVSLAQGPRTQPHPMIGIPDSVCRKTICARATAAPFDG